MDMLRNLFFCLCLAGPVAAGAPVVESVRAVDHGGMWTFHVTLRHADTGWDHYADGWGVYTPDGKVLGYRELLHPHVNEQPFTRSLSNVVLPVGATKVVIIPRDSVHGEGDPFTVDLP